MRLPIGCLVLVLLWVGCFGERRSTDWSDVDHGVKPLGLSLPHEGRVVVFSEKSGLRGSSKLLKMEIPDGREQAFLVALGIDQLKECRSGDFRVREDVKEWRLPDSVPSPFPCAIIPLGERARDEGWHGLAYIADDRSGGTYVYLDLMMATD